MKIAAEPLKRLVAALFGRAGCQAGEAERISHYLVEANLAGHDSHGVIRVPSYISWLQTGKVVPNQHIKVVMETGALALVDGQFGFGQVIAEEAMQLGIDKAQKNGV